VLTTVPVGSDATVLARKLVDERLAACVNILPVMTSVYRWKRRTEEEEERQLVIKTAQDRVTSLIARIRTLHPYAVPELLVIEVLGGSEDYLRWVHDSVTVCK